MPKRQFVLFVWRKSFELIFRDTNFRMVKICPWNTDFHHFFYCKTTNAPEKTFKNVFIYFVWRKSLSRFRDTHLRSRFGSQYPISGFSMPTKTLKYYICTYLVQCTEYNVSILISIENIKRWMFSPHTHRQIFKNRYIFYTLLALWPFFVVPQLRNKL